MLLGSGEDSNGERFQKSLSAEAPLLSFTRLFILFLYISLLMSMYVVHWLFGHWRGSSMSLEGSQLGRYHLLQLLGRGAMGEVYRAEDAGIDRQVAIKVIRSDLYLEPALGTTSEALRLFQHEMRMIARLNHPHILPLFDYGEAPVYETLLPYMVMPFCQDGSLAAWLKKRGTPAILSPLEVAHMVQQAAAALQHAHDQHIVHRDVKPSNFLIRHDQENPNRPDLLLADFGLARLTSASISQSLTMGGTPSYMAPEQWRGHPVPATDQYMLAVMAYELLTGRTPFQGNLEHLMFQHLQEQPELPSRFNPQIPEALNPVILQALAKQPEARFPAVSAFARAFQQVLQEDSRPLAHDPDATIGVNVPLPLPAGDASSLSLRERLDSILGSAALRRLKITVAPPKRGMIYRGMLLLVILILVISAVYFVRISNRPAGSSPTAIPTAPSTAQATLTATALQNIYKQATSGIPALNNALSQANSSFAYTSSNCVFTSGAYLVTAPSGHYDYCPGGPSFTNFASEVQMTVLKGDCGGIMFRTNATTGKYYVFEVCANGDYGVFLYVSPNAEDYQTLRVSNSPAVKTGLNRTNVIAVVAYGQHFFLYVNRQAIDSFSDTSYSSGQTGFVADSSGVIGGAAASTDVAYNDQKVWIF